MAFEFGDAGAWRRMQRLRTHIFALTIVRDTSRADAQLLLGSLQ